MRQRVAELVYAAVDDLNELLPADKHLNKSPETPLLGPDTRLESLDLVDLIIGIEQRLQDELKLVVTLVDEKAMSLQRSPFRTLESMTDYVAQIVAHKSDG